MDEELPPARKVVTRSPARTVRILNLNGILDVPVECESTLERDFVYRAALCPTVSRIRHQPFQLTLPSGQKYTPDFLVTHRSGQAAVVEVKLDSKVAEYCSTFDQAARQLHARGISFVVLTEHLIQRDRLHEDAALILRYRKTVVARDKLERVLKSLSGAGTAGMPVLELVDGCGIDFGQLYHLICTRVVHLPLGQKLSGTTRLCLANNLESDHEVLIERWFGAEVWATHAGAEESSE
jgi:hypothetical protein